MGSTADRSGPPIAHSRPEKDEGDCEDRDSPAEPEAPSILANTPVVLLTLASEGEEELPAVAAAAEVVDVADS